MIDRAIFSFVMGTDPESILLEAREVKQFNAAGETTCQAMRRKRPAVWDEE